MTTERSETWSWQLAASPGELWPLLSDTARFNEAAGTPRYEVEEIAQGDGSVLRRATARYKGITVRWIDPPYEWVAEKWFRQTRVFQTGPLLYLGVEMHIGPEGAGSRVSYTMRAAPRGLLGRLLFLTGFMKKSGAAIERMVREAAEHVAGLRPMVFEYASPVLPPGAGERLARLTEALEQGQYAHGLAGRLGDFVTRSQEVDLVRIRPKRLAAYWSAPLRHVLELCLDATRRGLLSMSWNLLCPRCGGAKAQVGTLDRLPRQAHCTSCNIDYDGDFARNVEISFQPAPGIRPLNVGEFCMGGPHVSRHILVQQHLAPGETRDVAADLPAGEYRLRALEPGGEALAEVKDAAFPGILALPADGTAFSISAAAPSAPGHIRLENRTARPLTLVIESRSWRSEATTAHETTTMQAFRDLLPEQVIHPGEEVSVDHVTLLFSDLEGSTALYERIGDGPAYRMVRRHFAYLAETVRSFDGALVKTIGDAVMAAFADPAQAVQAALAIQAGIDRFNHKFHLKTAREGRPVREAVTLKMGLHAGRCIAVNLNSRIDYFGSTVNLAARLQGRSRGGEIVLSRSLAEDPAVKPLLATLRPGHEQAELKGFADPIPFVRLPRAGSVGVQG